MRLHLTLTPNTKPVSFDYQHQLTGALHKWLGENDLHDKISLYSFSWLRGKAKRVDGGLSFPEGARWFISFWEEEHTRKLVKGILDEPSVFKGLTVRDVQIQETPDFEGVGYFRVAGPVLLRQNLDDGSRKHLTVRDEGVNELLKERLRSKMKEAQINSNVEISFDKNYPNPKTKLVNIKGTKLKANICPVKIKGDPQALRFAWNVGVGELTGSGMGALI